MTKEQIAEFLTEPLIARVATVRRDGAPHVVPVWFEWDGLRLRFEAQLTSRKVSNIRHEPRVSVVIDVTQGGFRYRAVVMDGVARVIEDRTVAVPIIERIFHRYLGAEGVATPSARRIIHESNAGVVEVTPDRIISWDRMSEGLAPVP